MEEIGHRRRLIGMYKQTFASTSRLSAQDVRKICPAQANLAEHATSAIAVAPKSVLWRRRRAFYDAAARRIRRPQLLDDLAAEEIPRRERC